MMRKQTCDPLHIGAFFCSLTNNCESYTPIKYCLLRPKTSLSLIEPCQKIRGNAERSDPPVQQRFSSCLRHGGHIVLPDWARRCHSKLSSWSLTDLPVAPSYCLCPPFGTSWTFPWPLLLMLCRCPLGVRTVSRRASRVLFAPPASLQHRDPGFPCQRPQPLNPWGYCTCCCLLSGENVCFLDLEVAALDLHLRAVCLCVMQTHCRAGAQARGYSIIPALGLHLPSQCSLPSVHSAVFASLRALFLFLDKGVQQCCQAAAGAIPSGAPPRRVPVRFITATATARPGALRVAQPLSVTGHPWGVLLGRPHAPVALSGRTTPHNLLRMCWTAIRT